MVNRKVSVGMQAHQWNKNWILWIGLIVIIFIQVPSIYGQVPPLTEVPQVVSLSELMSKPEMWLNVPVKMIVRFAWLSDVYIPFRSPFNNEQFINFSAWDIQTHIWDRDGFDNSHSFFYMEKDNKCLKTFMKLKTFETVCLIGKVECVFAGKPFIRIVWGCPMNGHLGLENLKMMHKSMNSFNARKFDEAITGFQKIILTNPPEDIQLMLYKTTAKIYMYEKKSYDQAMKELEKVKELNANDTEVEYLIQQCMNGIQGITPIPIVNRSVKKDIAPKTKQAVKVDEKTEAEGETEVEVDKKIEKEVSPEKN